MRHIDNISRELTLMRPQRREDQVDLWRGPLEVRLFVVPLALREVQEEAEAQFPASTWTMIQRPRAIPWTCPQAQEVASTMKYQLAQYQWPWRRRVIRPYWPVDDRMIHFHQHEYVCQQQKRTRAAKSKCACG